MGYGIKSVQAFTPAAPDWDLPPDEIVFGSSQAMKIVQLSVEQAANANIPLLLHGPSGTGKDIIARLIHRRSSWARGGFVKINCPAIPGTLLESELFGYQKGAFTGAYASKPGRVEMADGGTLFLDEIAELDLGLQAKILQLLQEGQFCRIGGQEERQVVVRFICATNRDLHKEVRAGTFRQDLFYRINVFAIELPSLQQRRSDIPMLVNYLFERYSRTFKRSVPPISAGFMNVLQEYHWPGNIRELENIIKRYVVMGREEVIRKSLEHGEHSDLNPPIPTNGAINLKDATRQMVKQFEQKLILQTLEAHCWNRRTTARALRISYAALLYKMREAGVPAREPRRKEKEAAGALPSWNRLPAD